METFIQTMRAGWGDMDFNAHMRNTAYLDKSADARMLYFAASGFPMAEFVKLRMGPVVMKDEIEYFKELNLLEEMQVSMEIAGLSEDGSRFVVVNAFTRLDGKLAAKVSSTIGWLDLAARKLRTPPDALLAALRALPRTADFSELASSLK